MAVFLDDEPVQLVGDRLADVLASATARLREAGRMVVEVQLDGQTLVGDNLTDQAAAPVPDSAELRLYSAQPRSLARQVLEQVRAELLDQQPRLEEAADLFQQDRGAEAFKMVNRINETWLTTMRVVEQASQLIGIDLTDLTVGDKPFTGHTGDLLTALQQFKQQLTDQDTAALADALGHEWPQLIEQWDAILSRLIEVTDDPSP